MTSNTQPDSTFPTGRARFFVAATLGLALTVLWTMLAGKDAGWDVFNHHYYIPFAWMNGKIGSDFFGAGPQSYQNPVGYLPFYYMVHADWPAVSIGLTLALLHGLAGVACAYIATCLWTTHRGRHTAKWVALATASGIVAPVFLSTAGTSSVDPISATCALAAVALQLMPESRAKLRIFAAGFLAMLAFAIKPTAIVFAFASAALGARHVLQGRLPARAAAHYALGGALAFAMGMSWYCWTLWENFRNPFFPLYNNIFHSPYASTGALLAQRFQPHSMSEWFTRPFEIAQMRAYVYHEAFVPDVRPALVVVLAVLYAVRLRVTAPAGSPRVRHHAADRDLLFYVVVAYVGWLATTGNGRYAVALFMLLGLISARLVFLLAPTGPGALGALAVCVLQMIHFRAGGDVRMLAAPWNDKPYFDLAYPARLANEPILYVTLGGAQTSASIAAMLNPRGALLNPVGQISQPSTGLIGERIESLLRHWEGRSRVLVPAFDLRAATARRHMLVRDYVIARFGLKVDWHYCVKILYKRSRADSDSTYWWFHYPGQKEPRRSWLSCRVERTDRPSPTTADVRADQAFAAIEAACPELYGPAPLVTDRGPRSWERLYANSDSVVAMTEANGAVAMGNRSFETRQIGSITDILTGRAKFDCSPWSEPFTR